MDESKSIRLLRLCVVLGENARSRRCNQKVEWSSVNLWRKCHTSRELQGLDGEPIDFEWNIFPRATALDILHENLAGLQRKHVTPENFSDRITSMSMFNDIVLEKKENEDYCATTPRKIKEYASKFNDGHWAFLVTRRRKQVVSRICNRLRWQVGSSCFTNGGRFCEFRTSDIPGCTQEEK